MRLIYKQVIFWFLPIKLPSKVTLKYSLYKIKNTS